MKPIFTIQKVIYKCNFSAFYIIIQIVKFLYCSNEIKIVRKHTKYIAIVVSTQFEMNCYHCWWLEICKVIVIITNCLNVKIKKSTNI